MTQEIINNTTNPLGEELKKTLHPKSRVDIAAACFSLYAFNELKRQLKNIKELRFIFTSPTFTEDKPCKERREFYIPRCNRERSLYGTEFELRLRNEMTQKAIAKECADWIRKKATFKSNTTNSQIHGFINIVSPSGSVGTKGPNEHDYPITYQPINGFTAAELGAEQTTGSANLVPMVLKLSAPFSTVFMQSFEQLWQDKNKFQDVTNEVIESISAAYKENSAEFIYFITLYTIFNEFLEDISEDILPNEATGFKESAIWKLLFNFQKDAALAIISKLEKYNGCILADSVGLGKTYTALSVIKYYENRNKSVLVLCPKNLSNNWNIYKANYKNNPVHSDRLRYDVLYHTDLSRTRGTSNGLDLAYLNWSNYDLIVIDESHNFRSGSKLFLEEGEKENRYYRLLNSVIRQGVKTKVLMLSATPVNTRFTDLRNQLQLAYEGDIAAIDAKLNTKRSINDIFKGAQAAFNSWSKLSHEERTTDALLTMLDFDFFEVLDSVTIARSRKHIEKYYDTSSLGTFPARLKPISKSPRLTNMYGAPTYNDIFERLMTLNLAIYTPTAFILESKAQKYAAMYGDNTINVGFTQRNREQGIKRLTAINLMKRLESSVFSFTLTVQRIRERITEMIHAIDTLGSHSSKSISMTDFIAADMDQYDSEDQNTESFFAVGKKINIALGDMDYITWRSYLEHDKAVLQVLLSDMSRVTPPYDCKLQELLALLHHKLTNPINAANPKVLIFTAFADTAKYLYDNISPYIKEHFNRNTAMVCGTIKGKSTVAKLPSDINSVLTAFSPISKEANHINLLPCDEIDILIGTDCIAEGQNLQDCDYLINYDIHWNPVRIIQRFGRIDRIGSRNKHIQMVNFWPDISLDEYINLKARVESRMKIVDMAATGDDNLLSDNEKVELEYRKEQLKRLQEDVVDIEDMSGGVSIMDLGLNEFRLDLLEYSKKDDSLGRVPLGLHAVVKASHGLPRGVIYVLKNRTESININQKNNLHPFYLVYVRENGDIHYNHLAAKDMLNALRALCKGQDKADEALCALFNQETKDGKDMADFSYLLGKGILSIIDVKEQKDILSFLDGDLVSFVDDSIQGIDDFELVCFLVVK